MSEPMAEATHFADERTLKRLAELEAENERLREKIEQLELLEARSAREADMERKRAEFWKLEAKRRVSALLCLDMLNDDDLASLMTMPEEPKP